MEVIEEYYMVIYTDQHRKKVKKYRDGILKVKGKSAELNNDEGKNVHKSTNFKLEYDEDDDEDKGFMGNWQVIVQKKIIKEDVISGRCYSPNFVPTGEEKPNNKCPVALAGSSAGLIGVNKKKPFHNPIVATERFAPIIPQNQIPQNAGTTKQPPLMKKFVNPQNNDIMNNQKSIPDKAHIVCEEGSEPTIKHTCFIDGFLMDLLMPHQVAGIQFMFDCITGTLVLMLRA